jgi:uncharacterized protein (DUF1330 family)
MAHLVLSVFDPRCPSLKLAVSNSLPGCDNVLLLPPTAGMEDAMKLRYALATAALSSAAVGTVVHTLHAQANPPVYMVAINEITDQEGYMKQYLPTAQKTQKDHGAVVVARGPGTQIDGSFPKGRIVVVRWESMEALNRWRHSPEYEAARKVGEGFAKFTVVAVDGVAQ